MGDAAIDAVLWDFGGVVTTSPFEAFNRYEIESELPRDLIRTINSADADHNAWARLERSEIDPEGFAAAFEAEAAARGHRVDGHRVLGCLSGRVRPRVAAAVRSCAERYRCICVTNNVRNGHGPGMAADVDGAAEVAEVMATFHGIVESSVVGVRKPEVRFYELALELADTTAERVVYLDDLGVNLKPARQMGMHTIKVVDPDQAMDELGRLTGLDL